MTLEQAIATARALEDQAALGWPGGYFPAKVRMAALACDAVFRFVATTSERAREIVEALSKVDAAW